VNPGFVLDLLPVVLSGVCTRVERIAATRVNDLSPYGPTVLSSQGVGLTPEAFRRGVESGKVRGHFGFPQSVGMIASALGWEIEAIEERREPIVSTVERETPCMRILPGQVAGCHHSAVARVGGRVAITLDHPQQIRPELEGVATGDTIEIHGTPGVRLAGSPEIPGGAATVALAVNAVPRVLAASAGLHSMVDLPVPAALPKASDPGTSG
jgi:4-hydroxy-tetrahydrodipicolinate reductase